VYLKESVVQLIKLNLHHNRCWPGSLESRLHV